MIPLAKLYSIRNNVRINGFDNLAQSLEDLVDAMIEEAENDVPLLTRIADSIKPKKDNPHQ